jgi:hypothetical protein
MDVAVVIAVSILALIIGVLTVRLAAGETSTAPGSGSEWKCHKLPYIEICLPERAEWRFVSDALMITSQHERTDPLGLAEPSK